jgi:hypothetical protein
MNTYSKIIKSFRIALVSFVSSTTSSKLHANNVYFIVNDFTTGHSLLKNHLPDATIVVHSLRDIVFYTCIPRINIHKCNNSMLSILLFGNVGSGWERCESYDVMIHIQESVKTGEDCLRFWAQ